MKPKARARQADRGAGALTGVILAAGKGSRMSRLGARLPKAVLPVLDEPLARGQLRMMAELGVRRALVVIGPHGAEVRRELGRQPVPGLAVEYTDQPEARGIAHAVGGLESRLDGPFLLFLGDIYFRELRLAEMWRLFRETGAEAVLGAVEEPDPVKLARNFCILTGPDGRATRVMEKPQHPRSRLKGVGVYLFSPVVFDAIRRTPRTALRGEYEITDSIQVLIDDGFHVRPCLCVQEDVNVTFPEDLLELNLQALRRSGQQNYCGPAAQVAKTARLDAAVIGAGARVGAGAAVKESLVFAGAAVPAGAVLWRAIVSKQGVCHCGQSEASAQR